MTIRGYARVSTAQDQIAGLESQVRDLIQIGATDIEQERISAVSKIRPGLDSLFARTIQGDVVAVTKLDRLARSTTDLLNIVDYLQKKQVGLIILSMSGQQVDTRSPTGLLLLTMLGAIAAFERSLLLERQKEGIAKAKKDGKYIGRPRKDVDKLDRLKALISAGYTIPTAANKVGMSRAAAYRHAALMRKQIQEN